MINLPEHNLATIKRILAQHVPECEVWAWGSRVTGRAKPHSDLDLVVIGKETLPRKHYYRLKEAFQESDLPIRVDLVDWHRISPEFRTVIEDAFEVLRPGKNVQDAEEASL